VHDVEDVVSTAGQHENYRHTDHKEERHSDLAYISMRKKH